MDNRVEHVATDGGMRGVVRITDPMVLRGASEARSHHEEFELYWFLDGQLWFAFEGERIEVQRGDLFIIANRRMHRPMVKSGCRYVRKRVLFAQSLFENAGAGGVLLQQRLTGDRIWRFSADEVQHTGLGAMVDEVMAHLAEQTPLGDFAAQIALLRLLLTAAGRTASPPTARGGQAGEMIRYIEQHLTDDLHYRTMARAFYLSEQKNKHKSA